MEKVGLKIVNLIHDITQLGYRVSFSDDFEHMLTIGFTEEYGDADFYHHSHCGYPGGGLDRLEKDIIQALSTFLEAHKNEKE